ncbi:peroxide stress protein YaaA [Lujinxingia litoralis]|uniref:UPF0246 protein DL240_15785 n=1 Tax=Lujinxingia litoralis TaxID=2211119 RepID=A0A328C4L7_9DELT|nr:peroxide stress protein YaaA [Lujinxingia litoralis]RAL20775.1 peroxide stress protein YaaA [Lujinxingia litoralis]
MLVLLSPSKSLDFETPVGVRDHSQPPFLEDSQQLIELLRTLSREDIKSLMGISDKLADLNYERYRDFALPFSPENARQALWAFTGDVYTDFQLPSYGEEDVRFAQEHLRMLSGLYGVLRPLDLIQPYRLEMGTRLKNARGKNLYEFWGTKITEALNKSLAEQDSKAVINLASNEYFKSVDKKALQGNLVTPVFRDRKGDTYKIVAFWAKRARGTMADYIVRERITDPERLKGFTGGGYIFSDERSTEREYVFLREEQPR